MRSHPVTNGAHRLAVVLLDLATRYGSEAGQEVHIAVPLSQEELASLAGASRATVTRALSNWRRRGIIRTGQRDITITALDDLRKIAGHQKYAARPIPTSATAPVAANETIAGFGR